MKFSAAQIADITSRILVTSPGNLSSNNAKAFKLRYDSFVNDSTATLSFGMAQSYDALYLLAYGIVGSGVANPQGMDIGGAFSKLVPGPNAMKTLAVGLNQISDATQTLVNGGSFDFDGASGPLDFDLNAHSAPSDIDIECVSADMASPPNISTPSSGAVYSAESSALVGTVTCGGALTFMTGN
jgi:branched-chain amino acid transport system substrate-binding protein